MSFSHTAIACIKQSGKSGRSVPTFNATRREFVGLNSPDDYTESIEVIITGWCSFTGNDRQSQTLTKQPSPRRFRRYR